MLPSSQPHELDNMVRRLKEDTAHFLLILNINSPPLVLGRLKSRGLFACKLLTFKLYFSDFHRQQQPGSD